MTPNEKEAMIKLTRRVIALEADNKKLNADMDASHTILTDLLQRLERQESEISFALGKPSKVMSEEDIAKSLDATAWTIGGEPLKTDRFDRLKQKSGL